MHFYQAKVDSYEYMPLSKSAESLLLKKRKLDDKGLVFTIQKLSRRNDIIKKWVKDAGIKKKITFHCARHTFATLLLTKGVDLYTVSKLLGHNDIATTLIYAKIIDKVRDDAVACLPVLDI